MKPGRVYNMWSSETWSVRTMNIRFLCLAQTTRRLRGVSYIDLAELIGLKCCVLLVVLFTWSRGAIYMSGNDGNAHT